MKTKKKNKVKQVCNFILDKSGSMVSIKKQAISGFNEYLQTMKKNGIDIDFTLTLFDTQSIETPYKHISILKAEPLNDQTYQPNAGTPLYDAAVHAIEELENYTKDMKDVAASVVIMTDGEENSSREHDEKCLRKMVDRLTKQGNWTFAYMGANQDAWAQAAKFGVSAGSTISWDSTMRGTGSAFATLASASVRYAQAMSAGGGGGKGMSSSDFFATDKKDGEK